MQTPPVPGWFAVFVRLMVDGTGEDDRLRGVVHARIDDDGGTEFEYRIARRGGLFRCETLDGKIHIIAGRDTVWQRRDSLRVC
jgi:hypothetical protein